MATWTNYWKILTPKSPRQEYTTLKTDSYDPNSVGTPGVATTTAYYNSLLKGPGSRIQGYQQYDQMDTNADVSRALDIIAEEIATEDKTTNLPFKIIYQTEENQEVSETTVTTVRSSLRHWCNKMELHNRLFSIARILVKYGDCFFQKEHDSKKWKFVDPYNIIGIEVDQNGNKVAYHIKKGVNPVEGYNAKQKIMTDVVPASAIIHFTLSDDMGGPTPFGESLLRSVYRVYRQLSMLEDSAIIYRLVRAPERRVFYIDVGNMPAQRVKQYLEQVRNDIRQKRFVNTANNKGGDIDTQYNPNSIQEDYFFPVTTSGRGSRVETLPGGENLGENADIEYFQQRLFRALRIPTSYMKGADAQGAQYNDGKVGIAYIEELRFAQFIKRLQTRLEMVLDTQFKAYIQASGINIDHDLFKLEVPDPQNFALYRQAALDADLINAFNSIEGVKYISPRFKLMRYLGWTEDELQKNEAMLKEERSIAEDGTISDLQQLYDPAVYENRDPIKVEEPPEDTGSMEGGVESDLGGGADEGDMGGDTGGEEPPADEKPESGGLGLG